MGSALGSLLIGEEMETPQGTGKVSERFPLNDRGRELAASGYDSGGDSERVRLRRALAELEEASIKVSGAEPSQYTQDWTVSFAAEFNRHGDFKNRLSVRLSDSISDADLEATQAALQGQGFASLVTEARGILVLAADPGDAELLDWLELGLSDKLSEVPLEDARTWIQRDPAFASRHLLARWYESGFGLDVACQWVETARTLQVSNLDSVGVASDWIKAGVSSQEAAAWYSVDHSLRDYEKAEPWRDRFTLEEAALWMPASIDGWRASLDRVDQLQAAGVDTEFFSSLKERGFEPDKFSPFCKLVLSGYAMDVALSWADLGPKFAGLSNLGQWAESGVSPSDAALWMPMIEEHNSYGSTLLSRIAWVADWVAAGLGPDDARPWIERRDIFWDYEKVKAFQYAGYTLESLGPWIDLADKLHAGRYHCPQADALLTPEGIAEWNGLGAPFNKPEAVGRMLGSGLTLDQVSLVLAEVSGS